ncbi:MAG TPA: hypothetical protein PLG90_01775 [Ignavibacteria bacterium]|nr:hypothetical protein [Ignavibacteria bacterium]
MQDSPQGYTVERKNIDGVWYLIIYSPDGTVYAEFIDPHQD